MNSRNEPPLIRCFAALCITKLEVVKALSEVTGDLRRFGGVKWVPPDQFHYTLKFLGEIPPLRVEAAKKALESASLGMAAFDLELSQTGCFPASGPPRIVWAGAGEGVTLLVDLARRVEDSFEKEGFLRESRPFSPHLTLGRVKDPSRARGIREAVSVLPHMFGTQRVSETVLFKSELKPGGPVYTPLSRNALRAP